MKSRCKFVMNLWLPVFVNHLLISLVPKFFKFATNTLIWAGEPTAATHLTPRRHDGAHVRLGGVRGGWHMAEGTAAWLEGAEGAALG